MIDAIKSLLEDRYWEDMATTQELEDSDSGMKITITELSQDGLIVKIPSRGKAHSGMIYIAA